MLQFAEVSDLFLISLYDLKCFQAVNKALLNCRILYLYQVPACVRRESRFHLLEADYIFLLKSEAFLYLHPNVWSDKLLYRLSRDLLNEQADFQVHFRKICTETDVQVK